MIAFVLQSSLKYLLNEHIVFKIPLEKGNRLSTVEVNKEKLKKFVTSCIA